MRRHPPQPANRARALAIGLALAALFAGAAQAGTIVTSAGRLQGAIALSDNTVRAGEASVNWADVQLAFNDAAASYVPATNALLGRIVATNEALHFRNGEVWIGEVTRLQGGRFVMETTWFGSHTGDVAAVRAVDFKPGLPPLDEAADKILYRVSGRPTPGELMWIDGDRAALDTSLGVAALGRSKLQRYVFAQEPAPEAGAGGDEIALVDGSVLRGKIEPVNGGLRLTHPGLGEMQVSPGQWQWVRRHPAAVTYVLDGPPESVETFPLIRQPAPPPVVSGPYKGAPFVRRVQISPKSLVTYRLPGKPGGPVFFCATLGLQDGARGAAHVKVRAGERVAFDQTLDPAATEPVRVAFDADGGSALELDVDFGEAVRLPCTVAVDDAYVIVK